MKPSARLLKIVATASLPRDVVALHASTLMEFTRIDYLARILRRPFKGFEIGTQVLSWDNQCFYVRHTFRSMSDRDRPIATAYLTVRFASDDGSETPATMVRLATGDDVIPPLLDNATRAEFGLRALPTSLAPVPTH
ncbi:MAG TPA: hypothetical protein VHT50_09290 [Mycobacterium sp.]|nr:hypothetical protein [Mycobacterium sp.]